MRILVTNDDGVTAPGLSALAAEMKSLGQVSVLAPDHNWSASGHVKTMHRPLRVKEAVLLDGSPAWASDGAPSDCVALALLGFIPEKIDLVVSGINQGSNLGEDVLISGTVGAGLAAYLRGFPAVAISCDYERWSTPYIKEVARFTALLVKRIGAVSLPSNLFLNVNMPNLPIDEIKGIKIANLAHKSHVNTVEESHDGRRGYYMLVRQSVNHQVDKRSDIWVSNQGYISISPLHLFLNDRLSPAFLDKITTGLLEEFKK